MGFKQLLYFEIVSQSKQEKILSELKDWYEEYIKGFLVLSVMLPIFFAPFLLIYPIESTENWFFPQYDDQVVFVSNEMIKTTWEKNLKKINSLNRFIGGEPIDKEDAWWLECSLATGELEMRRNFEKEEVAIIALIMWNKFHNDDLYEWTLSGYANYLPLDIEEYLWPQFIGHKLVCAKPAIP